MDKAGYWIQHLKLSKHPEGGYFREVYRSGGTIPATALPLQYNGERVFSTSIYFLLEGDDFSAFHRIHSDEIWHFYTGSPLTIHCIDQQGNYYQKKLGENPENNEEFQTLIPSGTWFGAVIDKPRSFSLVGCTVAPGFEFNDFELGKRHDLLQRFPDHKKIIERLTIS